jgi:hypothetical protein
LLEESLCYFHLDLHTHQSLLYLTFIFMPLSPVMAFVCWLAGAGDWTQGLTSCMVRHMLLPYSYTNPCWGFSFLFFFFFFGRIGV